MAWAATFDPFEALGLERDANPKSIKAQYYELARRYHPNRNQGSDESKAACQSISIMYTKHGTCCENQTNDGGVLSCSSC